MIDINKIRYLDLDAIIRQYPNPRILLGHLIYWQEKRDGSNIGAYLTDEDKLLLRSRNVNIASQSFHNAFNETAEAKKVKELLLMQRDEYSDECVLFGEMLTMGKSPTRIEFHEKHEFIAFDLYSTRVGGFVPYTLLHQHCYHFDIPIVEVYGTSSHRSIESLLKFRDIMLEKAKVNGREGVVGKIYEKNTMFKYFKEKLDTPKLEKLPRLMEDGDVILPPLPESEIWGALDKAFVDLGAPAFKDVKKAMPLFARYVSIECKKHICARPTGNLFKYYKQKLEDLVR